MRLADIQFLFGYDRWATARVLDTAVGVDDETWSSPDVIGERGLGGILVHALGAHQRWRHSLSGSAEMPTPERGPLPTIEELRVAWLDEWPALDAWLASLEDGSMELVDDGLPYWQLLAHVVNHGTQHRSEAAALLTTAGRSPGDLGLLDYAEALVSREP
ncbi:MAG: DinB family protein [Candidatus Limnocylindrales bacterium]|nr:DinB family protein [Candidatus Limnocylindrales bacterium]